MKNFGRTAISVVEYKLLYPRLPKSARAKWVRKKIEQMGPTYIKLGQFVASRSDILFDPDMKKALSKLHDDVTPMPWEAVEGALESVMPTFKNIERTPLAAASIGQVHRGTLITGEEVVIKIRRPDILAAIAEDIRVIKMLVGIASRLGVDEKSVETASRMADDVLNSMMREADLKLESDNLKVFTDATPPNTYIPKVFDDISSDSVLVMEYVPSIKFGESERSGRKALALKIMTNFIDQLLVKGVLHGDPHPGNVALALDQKSFVMYDFGSIVTLTDSTRNYFKLLIFEMISDNVDGVVEILQQVPELVTIDDPRVVKTFVAGYLKYMKTIDIKELKNVLQSSEAAKGDVPIQFSSKIFEIIRIFGTIEGICVTLDPAFTYDAVLSVYAPTLVMDADFVVMRSLRDVSRIVDLFF